MRDLYWKDILNRSNCGYAIQKLIRGKKNNPVDIKFLELNDNFYAFTNTIPSKIDGKRVSKIVYDDIEWLKDYVDIILNNTEDEIEKYFNVGSKVYRFNTFFLRRDLFVTMIYNISISESKMIESEQKYKMIADNVSDNIWIIDLDYNYTYISPSVTKILGYQVEDLIGENISKITTTSSFKLMIDVINRELEIERTRFKFNDQSGVYELDQIASNGRIVNMEQTIRFLRDKNNRVVGILGVSRDITERKRFEKEFQESVRSKTVLLSNLPGMAYRCKYDRRWTMMFVSEGCYTLTGYKPENLINNKDLSFDDIIDPEYREHLWDVWKIAIDKKSSIKEEYPIITADGKRKWVLEQGQPIFNEIGEVEALEGLVIDINDQKIKEEEIRYLSYHDGLTGLYNRIYFENQKIALNDETFLPLSIIIGDINGLKLINDAFGHAEGDKLIVETAKSIIECCREHDVISRTGGDEFTILLPNTDAETAYEMLKKIKSHCEKNTSVYKLNISLGFATKEYLGDEFSDVQKLAEDFMYKRKLLERNSIHNAIIASITTTLYEKSQETEAHAERMKELSILLGTKLDLLQVELDELSLLATLHDIGKVSVDSKILSKPGKLTPDEWIEIKKHPEVGYRIAKSSPELSSIADFILCHHERWDGNGYPQGLKGEDIPLLSRIIAIVDSFDAMTQDRPYRTKMTKEQALEEIRRNAGTQFDPLLAQLFIELMTDDDLVSFHFSD